MGMRHAYGVSRRRPVRQTLEEPRQTRDLSWSTDKDTQGRGLGDGPGHAATLVCRALQLVIVQRQPTAGLIVHSDPGSQYASAAHHALLAKHGLVGSMSGKGNLSPNTFEQKSANNLSVCAKKLDQDNGRDWGPKYVPPQIPQ